MMDENAYLLGQLSNQLPNELNHTGPNFLQLQGMGLHQDSIQQGSGTLSEMSSVNKFVMNNIAKTSPLITNSEEGQRADYYVPDLQCQQFVDGSPKVYTYQKMPTCQFQNMIQQDICGGSFSGDQVAHCLTSSFGNSNLSHPPFDHSVDRGSDCYPLRSNNANHSGFIENCSFSSFKGYNQGVAPALMDFDGSSMHSSAMRQVAGEVAPSPEQTSSITACSDADMYSDTGLFDGGPTVLVSSSQHLAESSFENYVQQKHVTEVWPGKLNLTKNEDFPVNSQNVYTAGFPSLYGEKLELSFPNSWDPQPGHEASGILPVLNLDSATSACENLSEPNSQIPGSQKFHEWCQQPLAQIDEPYKAQSPCYLSNKNERLNKIMGKKSRKVSHIPLEKLHGVQHFASESTSVLFGPTGAIKLDRTFQRILRAYMNYKWLYPNANLAFFVKQLHLKACKECKCNCVQYLRLAYHFDHCYEWGCKVCRHMRSSFVTVKPPLGSSKLEDGDWKAVSQRDFNYATPDSIEVSLPPSKRQKMGGPTALGIGDAVVASLKTQPGKLEHLPPLQQWPETPTSSILDAAKINEGKLASLQDSARTRSTVNNLADTAERFDLRSASNNPLELVSCFKEVEVRNNVTDGFQILSSGSMCVPSKEVTVGGKEEDRENRKPDPAKQETKSVLNAVAADSGMKSKKPKILGTSLIDILTAEEIKEHLSTLRKWTSQEVERNRILHSVGETSCQLCAMDKLFFAPATIYCSSCGNRIKQSVFYSINDEMGVRQCFCTLCFKGSRGGDISFQGISISKSKLHKEKNDHRDEELWVRCDKCGGRQHQICALYNNKRKLDGKAEYVCPICCLEGIEAGHHVSSTKTVAFGAKDLPTTMLSDYIEQWLFRRLKQEREERAKVLQKKFDEVPGAADLVVRVVLSVNKLLKVKEQFLDTVHYDNYPTEFPYRSKVILLFQKIGGADVCLFGMYVQEYGSECGHPNHRCVYISYLDSVKYFRPDIRTASGEALRTFVYHEILVGYLDYCKKRGFTTCYIWACPPTKGEDYILYCHPEAQKTPKSDKLRQWYKSMLRKAAQEKIVVSSTNLYDHFFVPAKEHGIKITASRLPYFDGDYWSGAAMGILMNIEQEIQSSSLSKVKRVLTKRNIKAMGHSNLSSDATKDILLMQKLGQTILPLKEDFIVAHLQFTCSRCQELILSGFRWYCHDCRNFQLCARCHDGEHNLNEGNTHTSCSGEKHFLYQVAVNDVPIDTDNKDVIMDNGVFDSRHSFLSFCQENHYQFDSLRRAKYSSMMILNHLSNLAEPLVGTVCCICRQNIVVNQRWHCEICPGFDACDGCYQRKGVDCHIHKLMQHSSIANCGTKSGQSQQQKLDRVREVMDVLKHASQCSATKDNTCSYAHCSRMRRLFHHARQCNVKYDGGCQVCHKTWILLRLHANSCKDCGCGVPYCIDLKKQM